MTDILLRKILIKPLVFLIFNYIPITLYVYISNIMYQHTIHSYQIEVIDKKGNNKKINMNELYIKLWPFRKNECAKITFLKDYAIVNIAEITFTVTYI
jgi:hypothetical protein